MDAFQIEHWQADHPRWPEWQAFGQAAALGPGVIGADARGPDAHYLAALAGGRLVGGLMFLVQPIGPEMGVPAILGPGGAPLREAKIRGFHVLEAWRGRGIGTALQRHALGLAAGLGCYQVRSRSELAREANYAIKRKLGFGMHPAIRTFADGRASPGVYWVKVVAPAES